MLKRQKKTLSSAAAEPAEGTDRHVKMPEWPPDVCMANCGLLAIDPGLSNKIPSRDGATELYKGAPDGNAVKNRPEFKRTRIERFQIQYHSQLQEAVNSVAQLQMRFLPTGRAEVFYPDHLVAEQNPKKNTKHKMKLESNGEALGLGLVEGLGRPDLPIARRRLWRRLSETFLFY